MAAPAIGRATATPVQSGAAIRFLLRSPGVQRRRRGLYFFFAAPRRQAISSAALSSGSLKAASLARVHVGHRATLAGIETKRKPATVRNRGAGTQSLAARTAAAAGGRMRMGETGWDR